MPSLKVAKYMYNMLFLMKFTCVVSNRVLIADTNYPFILKQMYYDYILVFINYLMKFGGFQPTLSNFTGTFLANTDDDPPSVSCVNARVGLFGLFLQREDVHEYFER